MEFLFWLEESPLSAAIAGSQYMYPAILAAHGIGMALVVGLNWAISLRVLGVGTSLPLKAMTSFSPVMWAGFWVNVLTGVLLTLAAASRVLVDPVFFVKIVFVASAVVNLRLMLADLRREDGSPDDMVAAGGAPAVATVTIAGQRVKLLAIASIFLWAGAVTGGRLMAYTFFRFWN